MNEHIKLIVDNNKRTFSDFEKNKIRKFKENRLRLQRRVSLDFETSDEGDECATITLPNGTPIFHFVKCAKGLIVDGYGRKTRIAKNLDEVIDGIGVLDIEAEMTLYNPKIHDQSKTEKN